MTINICLKLTQNIKKFRIRKRYVQQKLSEETNIDYKYLQRIEGKTPPNLKVEKIAKIVNALNVPPSALLE